MAIKRREEQAVRLLRHDSAPEGGHVHLFQPPFNGLGVGAPVARLYARSMGGDLTVCSLPGAGCDTVISFDMFGKQPVFQRLA